MFLIDNAPLPESPEAYDRLVLVFDGGDDGALDAARRVWSECKSRGFDVTYWQADETGRWQRRQ
jgi:DNA polymerase-3 subunit chi